MAALRAMNAASQAPGEAAAGLVDRPVLVVMGSLDPDFADPAAEGAAVAGLVRDGRVRVVEGAGHYPHAEFPRETARIVVDFLRELKQPVTAYIGATEAIRAPRDLRDGCQCSHAEHSASRDDGPPAPAATAPGRIAGARRRSGPPTG